MSENNEQGSMVARIGALVACGIFLLCCMLGVILSIVGTDGYGDSAPAVTPTPYPAPGPTGGPRW